MLGDMFNNNRKRDVCTREGQRMYRGKKYSEEAETGYMVCTSGVRKRLHVVMWETEVNGGAEVSPGCVIHHLDWDKRNNIIENLICVTVEEHERIHNIVGGEAGKKLGYEMVRTRVNGLPPDLIKL